jgi:hypothetical protein
MTISAVKVAQFMHYTPSEIGDEGLLVDSREHLLVRLNGSACRAWESLGRPTWAESCTDYANAVGVETAQAEESLMAFVAQAAERGWVTCEQ